MLSKNQRIIIDYLDSNSQINLTKAVDLVGDNIYANKKKHVGMTMTRMVNRGLLERVKPGLYKLGSPNIQAKEANENQGVLLWSQ